jgi:formylmethanofuran dehydrogenase subunit E
MDYSQIVQFHGHACPGLAIGYRMANAAMEELKSMRAEDEEIVAIVENDACGVDALQCVTGCTFGKGNLVFHDYGKQVYTLYSRATGRGVRVVFNGKGIPDNIRDDPAARADWILKAPADSILSLSRVHVPEPKRAEIRKSVPCSICGELVMETRLREVGGKLVCIPCSEKR